MDVEFANDTECYYRAQQQLTFLITFTRKANRKCRRLSRQLSKQEGASVAVEKCKGRSNSIQANMFVEPLFWVSKIHACNISVAHVMNVIL